MGFNSGFKGLNVTRVVAEQMWTAKNTSKMSLSAEFLFELEWNEQIQSHCVCSSDYSSVDARILSTLK